MEPVSQAYRCDKCEQFKPGHPAFRVEYYRPGHTERWSFKDVCNDCGYQLHRSVSEQAEYDKSIAAADQRIAEAKAEGK